MAIGTRRIKRFRETREIPESKLSPKEEEDIAYKEYQEARNRLKDALYKNRGHQSIKKEVTPAINDFKKSAGKLVDNFFDGAGRISDSVERDIRKHSIEGKIDNMIIEAMLSKNKSSSTRSRSRKPEVYLKVGDHFIREKDLPRRSSGRRR